jgi:hypothetical protein
MQNSRKTFLLVDFLLFLDVTMPPVELLGDLNVIT